MWVGTNDTPTSGEWSPTNNDGTSNMVEVESYQYDGGGVGDGNLTQVTDYPGWRGRTLRTIQDFTDGVVTDGSNATTGYAYNSVGMTSLTAYLSATEYPDPTTGAEQFAGRDEHRPCSARQ